MSGPDAGGDVREATIRECIRELQTSYPDHAWLNAACAALRALAKPDVSVEARLREALERVQKSLIAASIGSCDCNTKSPNVAYHLGCCRYLKLLQALDDIDAALYASGGTVQPSEQPVIGENPSVAEQIARDIREGAFPKKSAATLREEATLSAGGDEATKSEGGDLPANLAEIIETELTAWRGTNGGVYTIHAAALGISCAIRSAVFRASNMKSEGREAERNR